LILNPVKDLNLVYYFLNNQRRYVQKVLIAEDLDSISIAVVQALESLY
jgi:hypothetical protein